MNTLARITLAALCTLSPACASFRVQPAPGFAALDDQDDYDYRATNADGVVVSVRALRNRPFANLDFWTRAVDDRLRRDGYGDATVTEVRTASGLAGRQLRYVRRDHGVDYHYWVTLFVTEGGLFSRARVFLLEAGGDAATFERAAPAVTATIRSFRT